MTEEAAVFITTAKAGRMVAGRPVPLDDAGKPVVGSELTLTPMEAEYELLLGTISARKAETRALDAQLKTSAEAKTDRQPKATPVEATSNGV